MGKIADRINRNRLFSGIDRDTFARVVMNVSKATSQNPLADCQAIAFMSKKALQRLGVPTQFVAGYAAWRVDPNDDGAVSCHHPLMMTSVDPVSEGTTSLKGHCWLETGNDIIDFSTYQIPYKLKLVDDTDGRTTKITWKPNYLWIDKKQLLKIQDVINGYRVGAYYESVTELTDQWLSKPPIVDEAVDMIVNIYRIEKDNPIVKNVNVTGVCEFYND